MSEKGVRLGIDIGGTFSDFVLMDNSGKIFTKKVPTTHDDYSKGVVQGVKELLDETGTKPQSVSDVVHATTIVTNACIELTGAKVGLITTKGFRDVLEITRGRMPRLYDLTWCKIPPLVPRYMRFEVDERIGKNGDVITELNMDEVKESTKKLVELGAESIAVCLYNSPKNIDHEQRIGDYIRETYPDIYLNLSTDIMPLMKEYERTSETVVNAYVVPIVSKYLRQLKTKIAELGIDAPLFVMQSCGGMISADVAAQKPIQIVECGPAAGVVGAARIAGMMGIENLIAMDLGGTTCKASIVEDGEFTQSEEYEVGAGIHMSSRLRKGKGYVLRVPSIDIAEIGAGGGSIVAFDSGGMLNVGPRSAGSMPGPICYDKGGVEPALTDCYVELGYMNPNYLCGSEFKLNAQKSHDALTIKAKHANMGAMEYAHAAYRIANSNISRAIHAVSSERGRDPRKFTLLTSGGAAALHGVEVARSLGIKKIIIAPNAGVFSAYGLLCANIVRTSIRSFSSCWEAKAIPRMKTLYQSMVDEAIASSDGWGYLKGNIEIKRYAELRYKQQSSELRVEVPEGEITAESLVIIQDAFDKEHEKTFGHAFSGRPVEVTVLSITSTIYIEKLKDTAPSKRHDEKKLDWEKHTVRKCYFGEQYGYVDTYVLPWSEIGTDPVEGPVLVDTYDTTIVVPPGSRIVAGEGGSMVISIN